MRKVKRIRAALDKNVLQLFLARGQVKGTQLRNEELQIIPVYLFLVLVTEIRIDPHLFQVS